MRFWFPLLAFAVGCTSAPTDFIHRSLRERTASLAQRVPPDQATSSREAFTRAVIARDPGMIARIERARTAIEQAGVDAALPSPEASAQVWNVPFRRPWAFGDADMYMFELRQRLPAPGLLGAREREGLATAVAALAELSARERELARRVAIAWAEHLAAVRHHRVHHTHLAVVERMRDAARARLAVSRSALDELPRVDAERARVLRLLARYDSDRLRANRTLAVLAGRDVNEPLVLPDAPPRETVALPLQELLTRALAHRGAVLAARAALDAAREGAAAAHVEATRPEFMLGLSAWIVPEQHNGYGLMAGMTLPWLWGPGRHRERAAAARVRAEEGSVREIEDTVRSEVVEAHGRVVGALRELATLEDDATPAAERAVEAAQAGYASGGTTLLAWLDAARMRLDLAMEIVDLQLELDRALASLDEAVGEPIPHTQVDGGAP